MVERGRATAELAEVILEFALELGIFLSAEVFFLQFLEGVHQGFGHVATTEGSEVALSVGEVFSRDLTHA